MGDLRCATYLAFKKTIPVQLRNQHILRGYKKMFHRYKQKYSPAKFKGNVLLFRVEENHSVYKYLRWDDVVDNIKLITVKGHHLNFLSVPESIHTIQESIKKELLKYN